MSNYPTIYWTCVKCGATAENRRPHVCARCGAHQSFSQNLTSIPMPVPSGRARVVEARELLKGGGGTRMGKPWDDIWGVPGKPFRLMIHGAAGSGKTTMALALGEALSSNPRWGPCLYLALDEGPESYSFRNKLRMLEIMKLQVALEYDLTALQKEMDEDRWACIIIDSANSLNVTARELNVWSRRCALSWVLLLEETKDGQYKGDTGWAHWPEIVCRVAWNNVTVEKSRFGQVGEKPWGPADLLSPAATAPAAGT